MAEAIARSAHAAGRWRIRSAGLQATAGAPIADEAVTALTDLGVTVHGHQARRLTPGMIAEAHTVYTMTTEQRDAVVAMTPDATTKTICLDPAADIPDPKGQPQSAYRDCADHIHQAITARLTPAGSGSR
jgi:protein-tyrosine-phosphatase